MLIASHHAVQTFPFLYKKNQQINMYAENQKIRLVVAPTCGTLKKINTRAQLQIFSYTI